MEKLTEAERDEWAAVIMRRWGCAMDDESAYDNACRDVDELAPLIASREVRAWDRGYLAGGLDARFDFEPCSNPYRAEAGVQRVLMTEPHDGHPDTESCPGCPHVGRAR